jgi:hypothetical protein
MKSTIWISYDLGVRGDYESLYTWLDSHGAKECGDSLAVLTFKYQDNLLATLTAELREALTVDKRTRIYVIHRDKPSTKIKGDFLFGGRRTPPWAGRASTEHDTDEEI